MHRACWGAQEAERSLRSRTFRQADSGLTEVALPSLKDIGLKQVLTREFLEPDLLAKAEKLYLKIIADLVQSNSADAWAFERG